MPREEARAEAERSGPADDARPAAPLVSVMIAAYNRAEELRTTLRSLREQTYRPLEVLVVDDASDADLGPVVRAEWPRARFWRNERNRGYIANRSMMMHEARGDFLLSLDDDSSFTTPDALERAVARFAREPELGVITFPVHDGREPPPAAPPPAAERYVHTYIGCGHMLRRELVRELGGYPDFYEYYAEESEYCLRALNRGWRALLFPEAMVHHRLSSVGRRGSRIWAYSFRNNLWTMVMHMPLRRTLLEVAWKTVSYGIEAARARHSPRWAAWALGSFLRGVPRALRHREPLSREALRAYDTLRLREVRAPEELSGAPPSLGDQWRWFRGTWWNRRRDSPPLWRRRRAGAGPAGPGAPEGER